MSAPLSEDIHSPEYKKILPWAVLMILIVLSLMLWQFYEDTFQKRDKEKFNEAIHEITHEITDQMDKYKMILQGGAGVFASSERVVSREGWKAYYEYRRISTLYPGIQGIGFSRVIRPGELMQHIREIRSEGFPDYMVRPTGDRVIYTAIVFLEPFNQMNQRAFGFDMFSEPVRRAAMEKARDTGDVSMSGKVTLVQEEGQDVQSGFLIYVPIYDRKMPLNSDEERRNSIYGYVCLCPFPGKRFYKGHFFRY